VRWQSEHFVFRSEAEVPDIDAARDWLEGHFAIESALFGTPASTVIDYRVVENPDDVRRRCAAGDYGAAACTERDRVLTAVPMRPHELIHAYLRPVGDPPAALAEGMAMVFGCVVEVLDAPIAPTMDAAALFGAAYRDEDPTVSRQAYLLAASFVSYLVDAYGLAGVMRLYREVRADADLAAIDRAMRTALGEGLDGALEGWNARGNVDTAGYCKFPEASLFPERSPRTGPLIALEATPRVGHDDPIMRLLPLGAQRRIVVPGDGSYRFAIGGGGILSGSLLPTEQGASGGFVGMTSAPLVDSEAIVDLAAGTYFLDLAGRVSADGAAFYWDAFAAPIGATCDVVTPLQIFLGTSTRLLTWRPAADACDGSFCRGWIALHPEGETALVLAGAPGGRAAPIVRAICERGCGHCIAAQGQPLTLAADRTTWLSWELPQTAPLREGDSIAIALGMSGY
jgi:hypothetical protein